MTVFIVILINILITNDNLFWTEAINQRYTRGYPALVLAILVSKESVKGVFLSDYTFSEKEP